MKILVPVQSFYPSPHGGVSHAVFAMVEGLVRTGHEVDVVTTSFDIDPSEDIAFNRWTSYQGIRVYYHKIPINNEYAQSVVGLFRPHFFTSAIEGRTYDIVHIHNIFSVLSYQFANWAEEHRIPCVWTPHGVLMPPQLYHGKGRKKAFVSLPGMRQALMYSWFHTTSDDESHFLPEFFQSYLKRDIPTGFTQVSNVLPGAIFREVTAPSPFPFDYILSLGRIHPKKNLENLIEGYALSRSRTNIPLVIVGNLEEVPKYSTRLRCLARERGLEDCIIFQGPINKESEKGAFYHHARLFVLNSHSENFGMVLVEALARGTPAIASKGTPWEEMQTAGAGYWIDNDPHTVAAHIDRFFALSAEQHAQMRQAALAFADRYRAENFINQYITMYNDVIAWFSSHH